MIIPWTYVDLGSVLWTPSWVLGPYGPLKAERGWVNNGFLLGDIWKFHPSSFLAEHVYTFVDFVDLVQGQSGLRRL